MTGCLRKQLSLPRYGGSSMMWAEADRSQKKRSSGEINSAMIVVVRSLLMQEMDITLGH